MYLYRRDRLCYHSWSYFRVPRHTLTDQSVHARECCSGSIPGANRRILYTIPTTSRLHLARHLSLLHLILNRKNADIPEILEISFGNTVNRNSHNVKQFIENKENEELHSTHYMELELYEHIRNGNPKKLADFSNLLL